VTTFPTITAEAPTSTPALDLMYNRARRELDAALDLFQILQSEEARAALRQAQSYVRFLHAQLYRFNREASTPERAPREAGLPIPGRLFRDLEELEPLELTTSPSSSADGPQEGRS